MSEQHDGFLERHKNSVPAVFKVAMWLHYREERVEIPPFRQAPTAADHMDYVDAGDLFVLKHGERQCYQIKHTPGTIWTCREDWPRLRFFVADVKAADRDRGDRVWAYVICNHDLTAMAIARADQQSRELWYEAPGVHVRTTGNPEDKYCIHLANLAFLKL